MAEDWRNAGYGLYIHWPFCQAKCPYCDFNSHVSKSIDHSAWVRAYIQEISRISAETQGRILNTIYFGGGTPSLMHPDSVAAIIECAKTHWTFANDIEITLEANPGSVETGKFKGFHDAGVNRISMGIQALNDSDLRRLGRIHTVKEALKAFEIAQNCFDRVSFDLIYARQDQTLKSWESELKQALNICSDHLSLYQLTVESGTVFNERHKRGMLQGLPADDLSADMYQATLDICENHGLNSYEVSNFARPGSESRHNLIYWRYGDYSGVGPGAHSRLTSNGQRFAMETATAPGKWLTEAANGTAEGQRSALSKQDQADEFLMMGLRLSEGIDLRRYQDLSGHPLEPSKIEYLSELKMLTLQGSQLKTTPDGRLVLNAVLRDLMTE